MSPPHFLVFFIFSKMATFHAKGKVELIVPVDTFGILHVIEKCLCAMFGFHPRTVHVSKDETYDDNNNVINSIYQVLVFSDLGLVWRVNVEGSRMLQKIFRKVLKISF
jgi:Tat protein secretion system quality control protein TatD with DNase activity